MNKQEFYKLIFGDRSEEYLRKDDMKEFYDKMHNQNNVILLKGKLWYSGNIIFYEWMGSTNYKAKQAFELLRV